MDRNAAKITDDQVEFGIMTHNLNRANVNSLWASVMIEALVRQGLTHFVISPGSRSTPLAVAVAEHPQTTTTVHIDERGAAYFAVGYTRASGKPAVLICTSGTAAANYLPAIVEASQDNLPLLILTADRPPTSWNTGANQTILQSGIYSHYTRYEKTLPVPSTAVPLTYLTRIIETAAKALYNVTDSGPVHLNCPFEKPLEPAPSETDFTLWLAPLSAWLDATTTSIPRAGKSASVAPEIMDRLTRTVMRTTHGMLVFGRELNRTSDDAYLKLAQLLRWPVWVDIQSPARSQIDASKLCRLTDDILRHPEIRDRWQPNVVLQFGGTPTSQTVLDYLQASQPQAHFQIHPWSRSLDPGKSVTQHIQTDAPGFARELFSRLAGSEIAPTYFDAKWCETDARVVENIMPGHSTDIYEAMLGYHLSRTLPAESTLFIGNSMPIRDFDRYGAVAGGIQVYGNRGASGIDGNIATIAGLAAGSERPVIGIIGDLAALHDLNSLHLIAQSNSPVKLIIINNHGGGIFSHLPIAEYDAVFEPYFGTPHAYDFSLPAQQYGLQYRLIDSVAELDGMEKLTGSDKSVIIEIQTQREIQTRFRRHISQQIHAALDREITS